MLFRETPFAARVSSHLQNMNRNTEFWPPTASGVCNKHLA